MIEKIKGFYATHGQASWNTILIALLVLEFVVFGMANDRFLRPALLFTSINDNLPTFMLSLFVTLIMVTGGIDIQVSSLVGLTSITIGVAWQDFGLPIWGAVGLAFVLVTLCGALSGFLIAYCRVQAMVVTLGGSFLFSGMALLVSTLSKTESYLGISGFPEDFRFVGTYDVGGVIPIQIFIYALMLVVAFILLHKTKYGRKIFLTGVNQSAAEYSGINTRRVIMSTYILSAIAAAIAGTVTTAYLGTSRSDLGGDLTMDIITAVVLGGTLSTGGKGSIVGTALASFLIAFLRFGLPLCFKISTQYLDIPVGILLVAVIVGRSAAGVGGFGPWLRSLLPGKGSDKARSVSK
ncbi:ABC transporter permease [Thermophilibacter gallinarum]